MYVLSLLLNSPFSLSHLSHLSPVSLSSLATLKIFKRTLVQRKVYHPYSNLSLSCICPPPSLPLSSPSGPRVLQRLIFTRASHYCLRILRAWSSNVSRWRMIWRTIGTRVAWAVPTRLRQVVVTWRRAVANAGGTLGDANSRIDDIMMTLSKDSPLVVVVVVVDSPSFFRERLV